MTTTAAALAGLAVGWLAAGSPKAQGIRLLDVMVLGPFMVYVATLDRPGARFRLALAASGAAIVTYNGRNFLARRQWPPR